MIYSWTAHPARRRPKDVMLLVATVFMTAGAIMALLDAGFLALLGSVILVVATAPFWAPTRYALTEQGVQERRLGRTKERQWKDLRSVQAGPGAVLVSPFSRPNWLERYRGILMYLDGAERDRVLEIVRAKMVPVIESAATP